MPPTSHRCRCRAPASGEQTRKHACAQHQLREDIAAPHGRPVTPRRANNRRLNRARFPTLGAGHQHCCRTDRRHHHHHSASQKPAPLIRAKSHANSHTPTHKHTNILRTPKRRRGRVDTDFVGCLFTKTLFTRARALAGRCGACENGVVIICYCVHSEDDADAAVDARVAPVNAMMDGVGPVMHS